MANKRINERFVPCICKICGESLKVVTHTHAESHGYADAYELIDSGNLIFEGERNEDKFYNFTRNTDNIDKCDKVSQGTSSN